MSKMLPGGQAWFLRLFLQSMKQICVWDLAFAAFPSTIMSAVCVFPIAVQQQIVAVSCGRLLVWYSVCISSCKAVTLELTLFLVRMRQGCLRTQLSVCLSVCLTYSTISPSSTHWYSCSYYSLQSAAEKLWLMATVRAISQWFIKQGWRE